MQLRVPIFHARYKVSVSQTWSAPPVFVEVGLRLYSVATRLLYIQAGVTLSNGFSHTFRIGC